MLAGPGASTRVLFHALDREFGVAAVVLEDAVPRTQFLWRRIKRLGLWTTFGQVLFQLFVVPGLTKQSRARTEEIFKANDLTDATIPEGKITHVASANSPQVIAALRQLAPDVVIVNGTRILSDATLGAVAAPFLNMHAGITPLYRGVHGGYWALAEDDRAHCGVTVHLVDKGIDTGGIVAQACIDPTSEDNFTTYPWLQLGAGVPLLKTAIRSALAGNLQTQAAPAGHSRLWSHPTIWQYRRNRRAGVR